MKKIYQENNILDEKVSYIFSSKDAYQAAIE